MARDLLWSQYINSDMVSELQILNKTYSKDISTFLINRVHRSRRRDTKRNKLTGRKGPYFTLDLIKQIWDESEGHCSLCKIKLTTEWKGHNASETLGVVDRRHTSGPGGGLNYAAVINGMRNCHMVCFGCNTYKGAWDLVEQERSDCLKKTLNVHENLESIVSDASLSAFDIRRRLKRLLNKLGEWL
jgi:hypothetical protein